MRDIVRQTDLEWNTPMYLYVWTEDEANRCLVDIMQRAFQDVLGVARSEKIDMRTASLMRGVGRVTEAKRRRGVFP
jgi:glutamate dehydrogenase/leucine dehydrogenase